MVNCCLKRNSSASSLTILPNSTPECLGLKLSMEAVLDLRLLRGDSPSSRKLADTVLPTSSCTLQQRALKMPFRDGSSRVCE